MKYFNLYTDRYDKSKYIIPIKINRFTLYSDYQKNVIKLNINENEKNNALVIKQLFLILISEITYILYNDDKMHVLFPYNANCDKK